MIMKFIVSKIVNTGELLLIMMSVLTLQTACSQSRDWTPEDTEFYEPVPPVVESIPAFLEAPSDAVVLFDGSGFSAWESV